MGNNATAPIWKIRSYGEAVGDYQLITEWRKGHGVPDLPETIIPPLAIISERDGEPMAFAVCYQSFGIGVCFLEWLTTRPGLSPGEAKTALRHVIDGLAACTKTTHGLMFGYAPASLARVATEAFDFVECDVPHMKIIKRIDL